MHQSLQKVLENIEVSKLPSFPHVVLKLLSACQRSDANVAALSQLIDKDTGLSAKVIAAANSPLYGLRSPVRSLERTVVVLGLETIKTIAIASAVHQFFSNLNAERGGFLKSFWHHSMLCATLARNLATLTGYQAPDEAYLAGLLHDVGKLVLAQRFPDKYGAAVLGDEHQDRVAQEREHFGVAHHEVGFWLIRNWHLDSFMADAVLYHHEPAERLLEAHPMVRIVHAANLLAQVSVRGLEPGAEAAQKLFGLTFELSAEQQRQADDEVLKIAASLGIDVAPTDSYERRQAVQAQDAAVLDQLAAEVRNIGLLDGVRQQLVRAAHGSMLEAVRESAVLLFDVDRPLLFVLSEDGRRAHGTPFGAADALLAELDIPAESTRNIICRTVRDRTVCSSFDEGYEPSILDREIVNLAQREGIVCVPLTTSDSTVGVLVLGVGSAQQQRFKAQLSLLEALGAEIGRALEADRVRERERRDVAEECRAEFETQARALAHEVNNPLSVIKNYLHLLSSKLEEQHAAQPDIEVIREEIDRVGAMLRRMSDSSAQSRADDELDVNRVIADLVRVFRQSLFEPAGIEATTELDDSTPVIRASRSAVKQVLVNLFKNAAEALPDGGTVAIATRGQVNFNGEEYVEMIIRDNGPGIPETVLGKLFQPVQSTKGAGHAGLGLAIVHRLVQDLGGLVSCSSDQEGTRFQVLLPRLPVSETRTAVS